MNREKGPQRSASWAKMTVVYSLTGWPRSSLTLPTTSVVNALRTTRTPVASSVPLNSMGVSVMSCPP